MIKKVQVLWYLNKEDLENYCIDFKEYKSHKLDGLQRYFGLEDFHHHRADDDAEALAKIFFCMAEKMKKYNIAGYSQLNAEMQANSDPLSLPTYHQIILVKNKAGLKNLKGHRSVGGMRASIYNAMPKEGVVALIDFMKKFESENK